jgi:hypothetical protein
MIGFFRGFRIAAAARLLIPGIIVLISIVSIAAQTRARKAPDTQTQLLNNYRNYADRYIRISDEKWKYDDVAQIATHSFSLKNTAGVAYSEIELRVNYLSPAGKALKSSTIKIPGVLPAYQTKKFKDLRVEKVPEASDQAVLAVTKAVIHP